MSVAISFVTCATKREAERIARTLVRERLAACVNLVPAVASVYVWKGKLRRDAETMLVVKSTRAYSRRLAKRVRELHSYSVPEVVTLRVASGNPAYLKWVEESVGSGK